MHAAIDEIKHDLTELKSNLIVDKDQSFLKGISSNDNYLVLFFETHRYGKYFLFHITSDGMLRISKNIYFLIKTSEP